MTNLQTFNVFGEVLASGSAIIVNATALLDNGDVVNEVEVLDRDDFPDIPNDDPVRYAFVSDLENADRSKTFRRQVAGMNLRNAKPIDDAISLILKSISTRLSDSA